MELARAHGCRPFRIAFGHQSRVGKDSACQFLVDMYGAQVVRFAEKLYACHDCVLRELGRPVVKTPALLQLLGQGCKDVFSPDVWVEPTVRTIDELDPCRPVVVADLRHRNEAEALKSRGFLLVKIDRPNRPIDRDPNHPSETELVDYPFDAVVRNDGTLDQLREQILRLL